LIPIRDDNPTQHAPVVTYALIGLNVLSWIVVQQMGTGREFLASVVQFGLIPGELLGTVDPGTTVEVARGVGYEIGESGNWHTLVTHMFMHGGWLHLIGNMWFLMIFGNNVEEALGSARFAGFYLLGGLVAAGAQVATAPSAAVPMVGASGAIGAVMGGYALLFPLVGVEMLVFLGFFITTVVVPAFLMLGYWFVLQILTGVSGASGNVAVWAHAGGFVTGFALVKLFARADRLKELSRRRRSRRWRRA
jgi:membrane associated rhomboid family serine protease